MTDSGALDRVRAKLALLTELEAEHEFGVLLDARPTELTSGAGIPAEEIAVFGLYRTVGSSSLRFDSPPELRDRSAWAAREPENPHHPLGPSLCVGRFRPVEDVSLDLVRYDLAGGFVYLIDGDDLAYYYAENIEDDVPVVQFAPDASAFVDECLLGQGYVDVLARCGGVDFFRKGRFRGEPSDNWLRLLVRAGLADPALVRSQEELTVVIPRVDREVD